MLSNFKFNVRAFKSTVEPRQGRTQGFQKGGGGQKWNHRPAPPLGAPSHPTQITKTPQMSATSFFDFDKNKYLFEKYFSLSKKH